MNFFKIVKTIVVTLFFIILLLAPVQHGYANSNNQTVVDTIKNSNNETIEEPTVSSSNNGTVGISIWDYLKTIIALLFVIGLLLFVLRFLNKKNAYYQQNRLIQNLGGISVGSQKSIQLIQIGDVIYIVGIGENVQLLKEITNPEQMEQIKTYIQKQQPISAPSPYIIELLKKRFSKNKTQDTAENQSDFGDLLQKNLSDIQKKRRDELENWKEKEQDE